MEQNKLEQLYHTIEKIDDYSIGFRDCSVSKEFKNIRDNTSSSDIAKIAQLEMDCFNFAIKNGKLEPRSKLINSETHEAVSVPDIETFDEESYNYIKIRIKKCTNPIIISRYAMILWNGKKEWEYAKLAVDGNLKMISKLKTALSDLTSLTNYIINTYVTSKKIGYKNDEVKNILLNLIKDSKLNKIEFYGLKRDLIEFTIKQKKNFEKSDFKDIDIHLWKLAEYVKIEKNHLLISVIELAEKINNICSIKGNKWIELKAETYEKLAKKEENNTSKILHLLKAIKLNKELKNEGKKKELIKEYEKTKKKVEIAPIYYEVPFHEMFLELEETAKRMSEEDYEIVLTHLMLDNDLVGNYENLTKLTADVNEKSPLFFGMTKILYDERGHVKEQYITKEEREHFTLNWNYEYYMMLSSSYLNNLIHYAIINEKLSYDNIMSFIKDKTWLGKESEKNTLMFNHIFYISCIIKQYFHDYYIYLDYPKYNPQFVLTMDSLSLKIEGIIRDFCKILNISTTRINADKTSEEKSLNQLLEEEKLKEMIGEDDLFFLKFVLIDQGFNLRNKIAHSLMQPSEYNNTYVNLLILALFRLLKYELK